MAKKATPISKAGSSSATPSTPSRGANAIPALEAALSAPASDPNDLVPLTALARHADPAVAHKAVWALYRVWVKLISDGRVRRPRREEGGGAGAGDGAAAAEEVVRWLEGRLEEYVEVLRGALWDEEASLRQSAIKILLNLLPPLSLSASAAAPLSPPLIALPHFRRILSALYDRAGCPSLRGARRNKGGGWATVPESTQAGEELDQAVLKVLSQHLVDYDDLRWAFFREISVLMDSELQTSPSNVARRDALARTVLALLLDLTNLPAKQADINEFFIPSMARAPPALGTKDGGGAKKKQKGAAGLTSSAPDWMAYYESSEEEEEEEPADPGKGTKRKRGEGAGAGVGVGRGSMWAQVWSVHSHKKAFTSAWLSLLSLPLSDDQTRSVLLVLHSTIFPNLAKGRIVRITDWLGSICDRGGPLALLSLNGLFVLITQYNLEYPMFYRRLYALMDRNVLHVKYRARFFRLTATFLASPLLPSAIIASFIKRLAQLSLHAPPAAIVMTVPFIYNLFKLHPSCMPLLQRESADFAPPNPSPFAVQSAPKDVYNDPFDPAEADPLKTGALDSSLWELKSLQRHYLSHVGVMAKVFEEKFTKPEFGMEDFLDHGYNTLFATEINRKVKADPARNIDEIKIAFPRRSASASGQDEEAALAGQGDIVAQLWSFGGV